MYVSMQGNLLINFKSFHSKEKDNSSLNLLLLHFRVSPLQVLLPSCYTGDISCAFSWNGISDIVSKIAFFQGYFEKQKYSRIPLLQSKPGQWWYAVSRKYIRCHDSSFQCSMQSTNLQGSAFSSWVSKGLTFVLHFSHVYNQLLQGTIYEFKVRPTFSALSNPIDQWFNKVHCTAFLSKCQRPTHTSLRLFVHIQLSSTPM